MKNDLIDPKKPFFFRIEPESLPPNEETLALRARL